MFANIVTKVSIKNRSRHPNQRRMEYDKKRRKKKGKKNDEKKSASTDHGLRDRFVVPWNQHALCD